MTVEDEYGNVETGNNSNVTVAIGTGPAGGTLNGTLIEQAVNGVATFSDLSFPLGGAYTLQASDNSLTMAISSGFVVWPGSYSLQTLASFNDTNGAYPVGGLIADGSGNFYGTTYSGGTNDDGTVFEIAAGSNTITTLASFNGTDGAFPMAGLALDGTGDLFGTTSGGGNSNDGTVFEIAAGSNTITTLASFNGANGSEPRGGIVIDEWGNLYGTTLYGGAYGTENGGAGFGTVFELMASSSYSSITTLVSFEEADGTNGAYPMAGLIVDGSGNLYGTTTWDNANGDGAVFEIVAGSSTITTLASFDGTNGASPEASLLMDSNGDLFGTTYNGGPGGYGTVFELPAESDTITALASFNGTNGEYPTSELIADGAGNLYGTTYEGGANGDGTVFGIAPGSNTISTLASFNATNGSRPWAGLLMDGSGNLFATTAYGGAIDDGTVFELSPTVSPRPRNWHLPSSRAASSREI